MADTGKEGGGAGRQGLGALALNLGVKAGLMGAVLLGCGGTRWTAGWLYLGLYACWSFLNAALLLYKAPDLLYSRLSSGPPADLPDRLCGALLPLLFGLTLAVSGAERDLPAAWAWTRLPAFAGLAAAYALATWALYSNRFAVKHVVVQPGQTVQSGGPYALLRHPVYASFVLACACTPAALGSASAWLPAAGAALLAAARAYFEDRFLAAKLAGYKEYALKVRWLLIPGLW